MAADPDLQSRAVCAAFDFVMTREGREMVSERGFVTATVFGLIQAGFIVDPAETETEASLAVGGSA